MKMKWPWDIGKLNDHKQEHSQSWIMKFSFTAFLACCPKSFHIIAVFSVICPRRLPLYVTTDACRHFHSSKSEAAVATLDTRATTAVDGSLPSTRRWSLFLLANSAAAQVTPAPPTTIVAAVAFETWLDGFAGPDMRSMGLAVAAGLLGKVDDLSPDYAALQSMVVPDGAMYIHRHPRKASHRP